MEEKLKLGHRHHGEICNQQWAYFDYNAAEAINTTTSSRSHRRRIFSTEASTAASSGTHGANAVHLSVHVYRYSGSFYIRLAHGYAPIKLVPPFVFLGPGTLDATINICDIGSHDGSIPKTAFIGLMGSDGCAMFDVVGHTYIGGNCTEPRNFAEVDFTEGAFHLWVLLSWW